MSDLTHEPMWQNTLAISRRSKGVPYGGYGEARPDGSANYGFRDLKGRPDLLDEVPELRDDAALRSVVAAINAPTAGLFSVGCLSADVADEHGHRVTGYVEFALNSATHAADAANYFPAFFPFDRLLDTRGFPHPVQFCWELMGAHFFASSTDGFTAAVYINTHYLPDRELARRAWTAACGALEELLSQIPPFPADPIYPPP